MGRRIVLVLCLVLGLTCAPLAGVTIAKPNRNISMDFKSVDIHVLIKFISELTGENFIVDKRVGGRITVYSPTKISVEEAYKVFEAILNTNGFAIVPSANANKIVPSVMGTKENLPTQTSRSLPKKPSDQLVTQILSLENASASEVSKVINSMLGQFGQVQVYAPTNTLIVTAPQSNFERVLSIIRTVESGSRPLKFKTISLEHGEARDLAGKVDKIIQAKIKNLQEQGKSSLALIEADERVNSLLVLADPVSMTMVESVVETADAPTPVGKGDIHLVNLSNAKAEDLAKVLNSLIAGVSEKDKDKVVEGEVRIVADKATNSLVVTARQGDFQHLLDIIQKMDIQRRQVFIEALIMEVSADAQYDFGVNWAVGREQGDTFIFGSTNTGGATVNLKTDVSPATAAFPAGGAIGAIFEDAFKVGGTSFSLQAIASLSESDSNFKLLSTPQLMTLDNQKARVEVVENVPFVSKITTQSTNNPDYQSIEYKDVGVKLDITPHIGINDTVRLEIVQEVSRVVSSFVEVSEGQKLLAPTTKKREVETTIQMLDSQTVVIAGLLGEDAQDNESKVPWFGDIPILGWLFKYKENKKKRTNLFIFLTPRIVNTYEESAKLASAKRDALHDVEIGSDGLGLPRLSQPKPLHPSLGDRP